MPPTQVLVPSFRFPNNISDQDVHPEVSKAIRSTFKALTDIYSAIPVLKAQIDAKMSTTSGGASIAVSPVNITVVPGDTPAVAHEWIDSYDAANGAFHQSQPAFTDISGIATVAQGGTGTATPSLVAGANIAISGSFPNQTISSSTTGLSVTITTAQLTLAGTQGSMTFANGLLVAQTPAT